MTVTGATFTSASYEQSLQSALDKLGFKAARFSGNAADPRRGRRRTLVLGLAVTTSRSVAVRAV
jgi:hypothetical protein